MEPEATRNTESIVFLNEPRLTGYEIDKEFDEKRKLLAREIASFIAEHKLFNGKPIEVTFSHSGISSLVSILDTGHEKYVLKIPLKKEFSRNEAVFLKAWEQVGVSVPHVIEAGEIVGHPYILMEYIDALPLRHAHTVEQLIGKKLYVEMGVVLRKMHTATANGYGSIINGQPEFPDIKTWLDRSSLQDKFLYVKEHELLKDEAHGSLPEAQEVLFREIGSDSSTVYGHSDFSIANIFATDPLTVFDPIPFLNHPYMDLARTLVLAVRSGLNEPGRQIVEGYFGDEKYDENLLKAAVVVNAYMKLRYWHETNRFEDVKKLQDYLVQLPSLFESP